MYWSMVVESCVCCMYSGISTSLYAGRKLQAARCSVRHRSRQNVYVKLVYVQCIPFSASTGCLLHAMEIVQVLTYIQHMGKLVFINSY